MRLGTLSAFAAGALAALALASGLATPRASAQDEDAMAKMMENAKRYTQPGPHHEELERFLGEWDVEVRVFFAGQPSPPEKGTATTTWLMDGRWIETHGTMSMMGRTFDTFMLMGYDNFKQSYVATSVSGWDTAMNRSEGDMTPDGESMLLYGTIDEYLTGEHDKMVKVAYRFLSEDEYLMELHDLPIGEEHTKVVEVRYTRRKE